VAVIGASSAFGKWGQMILSNIIGGGFQGKDIPSQSKGKGNMRPQDLYEHQGCSLRCGSCLYNNPGQKQSWVFWSPALKRELRA